MTLDTGKAMTTIGKHTLVCASVHSATATAHLPKGGVDVIYTDPPWGPGHVKYFATMRAKNTGATPSPPIDFDPMMAALVAIAKRHARRHVFIEMGPRWADQVADLMRGAFGNVKAHSVVYGSKPSRVSVLLHSGVEGPDRNGMRFEGMTGKALVRHALSLTVPPGGSVFDPFTGLGMTGVEAARLGLTFYGSEFDRSRLDRAAAAIAKVA